MPLTQTGDPTGTWNYYQVTVGAANQWGDFPELGFNANWVVVSMNLFQIRGQGSYINTNLYVFSKADLYRFTGTGAHTVFSDDQGEFAPVRDYDNSHPNTLYLVQQSPTDFASAPNTGEIRVSKLSGTGRSGNLHRRQRRHRHHQRPLVGHRRQRRYRTAARHQFEDRHRR